MSKNETKRTCPHCGGEVDWADGGFAAGLLQTRWVCQECGASSPRRANALADEAYDVWWKPFKVLAELSEWLNAELIYSRRLVDGNPDGVRIRWRGRIDALLSTRTKLAELQAEAEKPAPDAKEA